jgi:endopeptidase Clp ATP-binding regulatory subunit ClpX
MTDENPPSEESPKTLEEQLKEMLGKVNLSFFSNPPGQDAPTEPPAEVEEQEPDLDPMEVIRDFRLKPREIRDYLDRFVIQQDEAKRVLSVAICDHYNHVRRCLEHPERIEREYAKHNIILLGPSGVGKTYLMRCVAKLIGVPMVKADATKFTETGYVGHDVEDLVRDLVKVADGNVELAQYGIIYIDEIDKIAADASGGGKDVSGRGVQTNLLKLMEETDVGLFSQTDLIGQMQAVMEMQKGRGPGQRSISTRHILFIVSGAFDRLSDQVQQRLRSGRIGFSEGTDQERTASEYLRLAETSDFIKMGFEPEFIGRLPIRVVCDTLSASDLERIMLNAEGSVLRQYREDFEGYGIHFDMLPGAVRKVAERAHDEKTGARGLMTVLERVFRNFKFELPSTPITDFTVDGETIEGPDATLRKLLGTKEAARRTVLEQELAAFVEQFERDHGIRLRFDADAAGVVVDTCLAEDQSIRSYCSERFRDFEYGFKLISRNTGRTTFAITRKFVGDPGAELSKRIAKSVKKRQA